MKFLCLDCDEPMRLHSSAGPDEGSLTVTFRCPECGFRVAMLTNPFETQMVRSLGVKIGGRAEPAAPFEHVRTAMADPRTDAFTGEGASACPFAAMVNEGAAAAPSRPGLVAGGRVAHRAHSRIHPPPWRAGRSSDSPKPRATRRSPRR